MILNLPLLPVIPETYRSAICNPTRRKLALREPAETKREGEEPFETSSDRTFQPNLSIRHRNLRTRTLSGFVSQYRMAICTKKSRAGVDHSSRLRSRTLSITRERTLYLKPNKDVGKIATALLSNRRSHTNGTRVARYFFFTERQKEILRTM